MSAVTTTHSPATASVNKVIGRKVVTILSFDWSLLGAVCLGLAQEIRAATRNRDPETERKDLKRRGKDI